jgi:hypothetical protein
MTNVYYSHSMKTYDQEQEKIELDFLQNKFERVFNPNKEITYNRKKGLKPYLNAVKKSDIVVCSEFEGHIGKGVFREISIAFAYEIPVLYIKGTYPNFELKEVIGIKVVNKKNPRVKYGIVIFQNK